MIRSFWERLPNWVKNKYVMTSILFAIWMAFFDQYNLISQTALRAELFRLDADKEYYQEEIIKTKEDLEELLADNEKLEKFAREKYFMKRENEDIFVFVEED